MSLIPTQYELTGLPGMMGFPQPVVADQASAALTTKVKPADPIPRPQGYGSTGGIGCYPGFGLAPRQLNLYLAWAMRAHPACVKVFKALTSPILAGTRSIQVIDMGSGPDVCEEIRLAADQALMPILKKAMPGALESAPFGHWLQEVVWERQYGRVDPVDIKPLPQRETIIHVDTKYHEFSGFELSGQYRDRKYAFLTVHDSHFDPILGRSPNENALISWFRSTKSADNADAVERKAAGIQVILYIAQGAVPIDPATNLPMDFQTFGRQWANAMARGEVAVFEKWAFPRDEIQREPKLADVPMVTHDIVDYGDMGPALQAHLTRQGRLDDEIYSAWGVNGRALTEAKSHGGFADASAAGDAALNISEAYHDYPCEQYTAQTALYWKQANYGDAKCRVVIVPDPLADPQQKYRQDVFKARITATAVDPAIDSNVDWRKLAEQTELPLLSVEDAANKLKSLQNQKDVDDANKLKQLQAGKQQGQPGQPTDKDAA